MRPFVLLVLLFTGFPSLGSPILKGAGLGGMGVAIERLDPDGKRAGLRVGGLEKLVRKKMRQYRVPYNARANADLYVRVVTLTSNRMSGEVLGYGAHAELSFRERVFVKRAPQTFFMAPTWFKGNVTVANPKQFVGQVVAAVGALLDTFFRDYRRFNP